MEAYELKLVNRVVPREALYETAEKTAFEIASYSGEAVGLAKQAVQRGLDLTLQEGLHLEKRLASRLLPTQG